MKKWIKRNKDTILAAAFLIIFGFLLFTDEPIPEPAEQTETEYPLIRWKEDIEPSIEPNTVGTVAVPEENQTAGKAAFYDVPLSEELQKHIFKECEKHNITPSVVIAIIEQESSFDASKIGDNGESIGLMQVQPKWHQKRMDRLGCTDLLNPFQNVTVGIDYLAELIKKDSDLYWVLMAYNGGNAYSTERIESGNYSDYALKVSERLGELEQAVHDGY